MERIFKSRRILLFVIVLLFFFGAIFELTVNAKEKRTGEGTQDNPYLLYDADDLIQLSKSVNEDGNEYADQYFALANDIDMSEIEFTPIGVFGGDKYFYGVLDGNGYAIKNISINDLHGNNGLFGVLGGTVANLKIEGGYISGGCCGIISSHAASESALIINCETKDVVVSASRAGGVVDNFAGTVINNVSYGCELNGTDSCGGISSYNIGNESYGNYYSFSTTKRVDSKEKRISGCEPINISNLDKIINNLNSDYRLHGYYTPAFWGFHNIWKQSKSGTIELSNKKQRELFLSNLSKLAGTGSKKDPFIIGSVEDLCIFRDAVNSGYDFYNEYVQQNTDIDLKGEVWTPIGQFGSNNYFYGIYNGNGHTIKNLKTIKYGNNGFFGMLGGRVVNLGIESGLIQGACCGAITSHAATSGAVIINCYNKADVVGVRAGGIVDNFSGTVICCWSDCNLDGSDSSGGITSYRTEAIYFCRSSFKILAPKDSMDGKIIDSEAKVSLSGDNAEKVAAESYYNLSKVKEYTSLDVDLYGLATRDKHLYFSDKPRVFDLRIWLHDNIRLCACVIVIALLYACLIFRVGPKRFYEDNRSWVKRFVLILSPILLLFYMFYIHSPIEFYLINNTEFEFVLGDFVYKFIAIAIIGSLIISLLLAFVRGILCDILACAVFGLDLCMYIQVNFMNTNLGLLDGNAKEVNSTWNCVNVIIWVILFLLPFLFFFIYKQYRSKLIVFVCGALGIMQITSIVFSLVQSPNSAFVRDSYKYILNGKDQFKVSANKNIIILVIDAYSNEYLEDFFDEYPEVKDVLKDFTYYNNADCHYEGSVYSINYIASGTEWDPSVPINKWCETEFDNEKTNTFYSRLSKSGYIFNIYTGQFGAISNDAKHDMIGKVNNMVEAECDYEINDDVMFDLFVNAGEYRFAPTIWKPQFEFTASDYTNAYTVLEKNIRDVDARLLLDNADFYQRLVTKGLELDDSKNYCVLQHLSGIHGPYTTNEQCEKVPEATQLETERGCWRYVDEYLKRLKELGVYDESTVIITADHGKHHDYNSAQPIFFIKGANETHDAYIETNAPISFTDIMPTVLYLTGSDYSDIGTTIYEHTDNEKRERTLYVRRYDEELPSTPKMGSPTDSILNCFYKYVYTGDREDLRALGKKGPTEKIHWTDSFY